MKTIYKASSLLLFFALLVACEDVSDLKLKRVVAPLTVAVEDTATDEVTATFAELDKSGILDKDIGIVSIPVTGLSVEVFAGSVSLGTFMTDTAGKIIVPFTVTKPDGYSGTYKDIKFFIKK